jgi:hypothetical protein
MNDSQSGRQRSKYGLKQLQNALAAFIFSFVQSSRDKVYETLCMRCTWREGGI